VRVAKVRPVKTPARGTPQSAGLDFFVPDGVHFTVQPGSSALIPSGIKVSVPKGHALVAFNKSGIATKRGLIVGACVVDEDYQGEIHLHLMNVGQEPQEITAGDKITQFVLLPVLYDGVEVVEPSSLYEQATVRGDGAFGSTGVR
jgi:dUTP pyrophosphatase